MKFITGARTKMAPRPPQEKPIVLTLTFEGIEKFQGFDFSISEGLRLAKRSYTEFPEFVGQEAVT